MKTPTQHFKKAFMWHKVNELHSKGLNKSQISVELGIYRSTVRKYLLMDEQRFLAWISVPQHRPKKLNEYRDYVKRTLESHPYLSASQVEDWLKVSTPSSTYFYNIFLSINCGNRFFRIDSSVLFILFMAYVSHFCGSILFLVHVAKKL